MKSRSEIYSVLRVNKYDERQLLRRQTRELDKKTLQMYHTPVDNVSVRWRKKTEGYERYQALSTLAFQRRKKENIPIMIFNKLREIQHFLNNAVIIREAFYQRNWTIENPATSASSMFNNRVG